MEFNTLSSVRGLYDVWMVRSKLQKLRKPNQKFFPASAAKSVMQINNLNPSTNLE
jgi:hypothetical protein